MSLSLSLFRESIHSLLFTTMSREMFGVRNVPNSLLGKNSLTMNLKTNKKHKVKGKTLKFDLETSLTISNCCRTVKLKLLLMFSSKLFVIILELDSWEFDIIFSLISCRPCRFLRDHFFGKTRGKLATYDEKIFSRFFHFQKLNVFYFVQSFIIIFWWI